MNEFAYIIQQVAIAAECSEADLLRKSQMEHIADGRAIAQYLLRKKGWSLQRIGTAFNAHHTSVVANTKKIERANRMTKTVRKIQELEAK